MLPGGSHSSLLILLKIIVLNVSGRPTNMHTLVGQVSAYVK